MRISISQSQSQSQSIVQHPTTLRISKKKLPEKGTLESPQGMTLRSHGRKPVVRERWMMCEKCLRRAL
jgi:hypothetical protein